MAIITLTTDLGNKDHYVASLKAVILSENPDVTIIDISHDIEPFNIQQASHVLKNCYQDFPQGSIHIIGVDDELSLENEHLAVELNGHFFIGADNGLFSLLLNELHPDKIVQLSITQKSNSLTFATKDILAIAACHIARGGTLEIIGKVIDQFHVKKQELKPVIEKDLIKGLVVHIDNYGNANTNISKSLFNQLKKDRDFTILFGREDEIIKKIRDKYKEVPIAEKLAIFNNNDMLQIAINQGRANKLLGLKFHNIIRIEFK
ncbi:MAG: SAM-dependent chlorinase/fluorinase [Bacteroidota bacterium]|nr:SAM-dependent chlorinase/fluorinase [Bacteroidota bacterium]